MVRMLLDKVGRRGGKNPKASTPAPSKPASPTVKPSSGSNPSLDLMDDLGQPEPPQDYYL